MKNSKKFWDKQAKSFEESDDKEVKDLVAMSKKYIHKKDLVLDFACGTGGSSYEMSKIAGQVLGIDYSEAMIKVANKNLKASNNLKFMATTIEDAILEDHYFDLITAFNILHLIDDLDHLLEVVYKKLKVGGVFISMTPCLSEHKNIMTLFIRLAGKLNVFPRVHGYTCHELDQEIIRNGFLKLEGHVTSEKVPNAFGVFKKQSL
jgi:ubiquinone/menaquinone biosynthesis C-methylase UbiE